MLGTSLLLTLIRRLFGADRHDRRRFDHYYGVRALDDSARKTLQAASACIGCGRCDRVPGLMNLVLSWSRCSSDWDACAHMFADLPAEQVQRQQDRCPASVPLVQLVTLVRSR